MITQTHDSDTCTAGFNGQPCEMCHFAREFEKNRSKSPSDAPGTENQPSGFLVPEAKNRFQGDSSPVEAISAPDFTREWDTAPAPDFEQEWSTAPASRTRYTEKAEAEHWFLRGAWAGIRFARMRAAIEVNGDLREMQRVARERISR